MKNLIILLLTLLLTNCSKNNNDLIDAEFEKQFQSEIKKSNAEFFDYDFDALTPSDSYFVKGKIRFLKYHNGGENTSIDTKIYFDKNDSISKIIIRKFEREDYNKDYDDSISVTFPREKTTEIFIANKKINSKFRNDLIPKSKDFIFEIKKQTELEYKKRKNQE